MYRITVEVVSEGVNLKANITKIEKRTTEDTSSGTDDGWTIIQENSTNVLDNIIFENTYNPTEIRRAFQPTKELIGREMPLQEGEFTFTISPEGSLMVTEEMAKNYHNAVNDEEKLTYLKSLDKNDSFTSDQNQPMPANVTDENKVTNGDSGAILISPITYTSENMGGNAYGKIYKYTITEDLPKEAINGKYNGIIYDTDARSLYVYVHLHNTSGNLATLNDLDTLVYADILGDRNSTFTNQYVADQITIDLGSDLQADKQIILEKELVGRPFQKKDKFTFQITSLKENNPLPKDTTGKDIKQITITPDTGQKSSISFGKITFTQKGIYEYILKEIPEEISNMTYDTEEKKLIITINDDGKGNLIATTNVETIKWTNIYVKPEEKDPDNSNKPEDKPSKDPAENISSNTNSNNNTNPSNLDSKQSKLPQTGMLWWPVWVLDSLGVSMLFIGLLKHHQERKKHEK